MDLQRTQSAEISPPPAAPHSWKPAIDPHSGRTYYYDAVSRKSQWEKPAEIRADEKRARREQRQRDKRFFKVMEANVRASLARNELIPGICALDIAKEGPPLEPLPLLPPQLRVRTISAMDERMLIELNSPSNMDCENPATNYSVARTTTSNLGLPNEGRPPLPQRPSVVLNRENSSDISRAFESMESLTLSPDARDDSLQGEHLLDGPILDEADDPEGLAVPQQVCAGATAHVRRNTGNTIYLQATMTNPNIQATIQCVCGVYRAHIVSSTKRTERSPVAVHAMQVNMDVFQDLSCRAHDDAASVPTLTELESFYQDFFKRSQMEHDTIIMSLIYVERLIKDTNGHLCPSSTNWKSVLFSCMILASKVWDDLSMWNIDFSNVSAASGLSSFSLQRINDLEIAVLHCLNFNVRVPASEYAKYYFLIRTMLIRSGLLEDSQLPLGRDSAEVLERRTNLYQDSKLHLQRGQNRRARSVDWNWIQQTDSLNPTTNEFATVGPVLKDQICLEQIVSMDRTTF
jgi:hypothetical protein